jgi:hypothetical protein
MTDLASLPAPPIDADVDLTDFAYMPLQVARLRKSKGWLICKRRPELAFYMMNLWTAAWHENPAGSLEDDDDVLADFAMCPPKEWAELRKEIMRGWVKCSDGRLYHEVVVEIALNAWKSKLEVRYDRERDRLRKENSKRKQEGKGPLEIPEFDQWNSARRAAHSAGSTRLSAGTALDGRVNVAEIPGENALKGREGKVREGNSLRDGAIPPESAGNPEVSPGYERQPPSPHEADPAPVPTPSPPELSPAAQAVLLTESEHMEGFSRVKAKYPKPPRWYDEQKFERNCRLLIDRKGETWDSLEARVTAFADHVSTGGMSPDRVYNPENFFEGDKGPWTHDWKPVVSKADANRQEAARLEANRLEDLKEKRVDMGLEDFRDPYPNETAGQYDTQLRIERNKRGGGERGEPRFAPISELLAVKKVST